MNVKDYKGVDGLRYKFEGHTYAICDIDYEGVTPENYSNSSGGGWCALSVVDVDSQPIKDSIYPIFTMFFDWDANHEMMHPTKVESWDAGDGYDIDHEELVYL